MQKIELVKIPVNSFLLFFGVMNLFPSITLEVYVNHFRSLLLDNSN